MALSTVGPGIPTENITTTSLHANEELVSIPADFPLVLRTDLAWTGETFHGDGFITHLTADDIKEADLALGKFKCE